MRVLVQEYNEFGCVYHICLVLSPHPDAGKQVRLDLDIDKPMVDNPKDLIGKTVEINRVIPYISIAMDCKIVTEEGAQMSHDSPKTKSA